MLSNRNIFLLTVVLLVAFMQILWPLPIPTNQLFMLLGMMMVVLKAAEGDFSLDIVSALFLLTIVLSIVSNDIPPFFRPWSRFVQFVLLFVAASPMVRGKEIDRIRRQMTMGVLWSTCIIAGWSFAGYYLGFGRYIWGGISSYMGVTAHPNFLGMYVMVAMVFLCALFFRATEMVERLLLASGWGICLIVLLICASRASLASGLLASLVVVYLRMQRSATKIMNAGFLIGGLSVFLLPFLLPYASMMQKKDVNNNTIEESIVSTRGFLWNLRIQEISESPYVGVGAFACDTELPGAEVFYGAETGSVELGSSYLGLMSQMGVIGLLSFLAIFGLVFWRTYRYATGPKTPYAQLMLGLLTALMTHMIFEGYAITAGAVQCIILWFVVGAASQCDQVADYPVWWEEEQPITPEEYEQWDASRNEY